MVKVGLVAALLLLSGCGNEGLTNNNRNMSTTQFSSDASSIGGGYGASVTGLRADYTCPGKKNVKPNYDWDLNGSGFYEACGGSTDVNKMALFANQPPIGRICVFPAQAYDTGQVFVKPGLDTLPIVYCSNLTAAGIPLQFANMSYNAVFTVLEADKNMMQNCLMTGISSACPRNWSYGRFR